MRALALILLLTLCTSCVAQGEGVELRYEVASPVYRLNTTESLRWSWLANFLQDAGQTNRFKSMGLRELNPIARPFVEKDQFSFTVFAGITAWGIDRVVQSLPKEIQPWAYGFLDLCEMIAVGWNHQFGKQGIPLFIPVFSKRF